MQRVIKHNMRPLIVTVFFFHSFYINLIPLAVGLYIKVHDLAGSTYKIFVYLPEYTTPFPSP